MVDIDYKWIHGVKTKLAFTLAEMMVVLLILSIILAAFAPIMTKRTASKPDSYWHSDNSGVQIYYGTGDNNMVLIGNQRTPAIGENARLIINTINNDAQNHILFKRGNNTISSLRADANNGLIITANGTSVNNGLVLDTRGANNMQFLRNGTALSGFLQMNTLDSIRLGGTQLQPLVPYQMGLHNTGVGIASLGSFSNGYHNTAVGSSALCSTSLSYANTAVGSSALCSDTPGNNNTAIGYNALTVPNSGSNTVIGANAASGATSGASPLQSIGYNNIVIGNGASSSMYLGNIVGSNKTIIGALYMNAPNGSYLASLSPTASDNIERMYLGYLSNSGTKIANTNRVLEIHNQDSTQNGPKVVINGDLLVAGNIRFKPVAGGTDPCYVTTTTVSGVGNILTCQNTGVSEIYVTSSDIRLKNVKGENKSGLDKIKQLKVFNYTFKNDKKKTPHVGVIAQDLMKVFPDAVSKDEKGYLQIRWEDMFYAFVNAVKELADRDAAKDAKIKALEAKNNELEERITRLEAKLK